MEQAGPGRPEKGAVYGQDSHWAGRDPLGFKGRWKGITRTKEREPSRKSPLSLENVDKYFGKMEQLENFLRKNATAKMITEGKEHVSDDDGDI